MRSWTIAWLSLAGVIGCDAADTGAPTSNAAVTHAAVIAPADARQAVAAIPDVTLSFREGDWNKRLSLRELAAHATPRVVETDDPYYETRKRFAALPLVAVLETAFARSVDVLRTQAFVLRALDGYAVPIAGERLLDSGAFIAFDDMDVPGFAPIGPQRVSPKPTYLVWTRPGQHDLDTHPRPWQLSTIEIAPIEALYPHTVPTGEARDSIPQRGHRVFLDHCIKCHAINREGGRVGPELNVPQSIVEYRPVAQIRAYIRDPLTFRYGAMPAHPTLTDADLDALIAYFEAMSRRKHDPDRAGSP